MDFAAAYDRIAGFLESRGYPVAVIGGWGLHAYGITRATFDLDIVTDRAARDELIAYLLAEGYETLHVSEGFSNHSRRTPVAERIDFVYVDTDTSRKLFADCRPVLTLGGKKVPVPRPEHLAAMKVQAMKNDPARALQEMADIRELLRLPGVDVQEVRAYFEKAGLQEEFDEIRRRP